MFIDKVGRFYREINQTTKKIENYTNENLIDETKTVAFKPAEKEITRLDKEVTNSHNALNM